MSFREVLVNQFEKKFSKLSFCGTRIRWVKPNKFQFAFFLFILLIRGLIFLVINKFSLNPESLRAFSYIETDCLNTSSFDDTSEIRLIIDFGC